MEHRFVTALEKALGWTSAAPLGTGFARGSIEDFELLDRLLNPRQLLDLVMRRSVTTPQFRIFQGGSELHPGRYIDPAVTRRGQAIPMADMRRVGALMREGCTMVLDEVDFFDPTMEATCRALQWWARELVQVNAYLTTKDASGFNLHWDDHDTLIVQLAGQKTWEVRGASRPAPMYRDSAPNTEPSDEIVWQGTMQAGDVMHIPRGFWHQATRADQGDGYSLHATFGIVKRVGVNWLAWLADQARTQELFRRDLDRWGASESWVEQQRVLAQAVAPMVAQLSPQDFFDARERERLAARHVPATGLFGQPEAIVCVTDFEPVIQRNDGTVEVLAVGKKLTFAGKAYAALGLLLSGHPVRIADAAETTGLDVAQLAEILVKEEVCTELTPVLSSAYTGLVTDATS
ncbi:cupin domain-containing protein [Streptomyces sp. NBC_01443]|uniref:JmjC domain-containing protein n=1 Tax=Streptomyces sp. NBC_01443 TaxID=2903868 RepID=UPI00224D129E|nr:cupin domain-containing protein [Streptomyces sp. NBC_01443]MCX4632883.1 cupin domain-containing protein [Streptomyces sp. NBC_01443]